MTTTAMESILPLCRTMTTTAGMEGDMLRVVKCDGVDDHWHEWHECQKCWHEWHECQKCWHGPKFTGFKKTLTIMDTKPCNDAK